MPLKRLLNLFGDRLHSLPLLVLYLTDGCNSKCAMCDIWRNPRRNMSASLIAQIVEAFPALGVRHVLLSGGEAMQHPDWPQIATQLRAAGARVIAVALTTPLSLPELVLYAGFHFATEERYMARHGYPAREEHETLHAYLLQEIAHVRDRMSPGGELTVLQTIKDWLLDHIDNTDKDLGVFLAGRGVR